LGEPLLVAVLFFNINFTKMDEKIFIHEDVESLKYFSDKNGICAYCNRATSYAMQGANIVGVFYTQNQLKSFYEHNKHKENLPIIYYYDEKRWNNRVPKNSN